MEDFVPYELAVKLKEKGFKKECLCHYIGNDLVYNIESPIVNNQLWFCHNKYDNIWHRDNIDAPTIPQVLEWLREEKKIFILIDIRDDLSWFYEIWGIEIRLHTLGCVPYQKELSYELAALAGIEYCLDNLI